MTRLAFHYANIKHESIEKMSPAQKDEALHDLIDLLDITKKHVYNPGVSPQTRIFALATILERAQKTGTRKPDGDRVLESVTQQVPTWIGDKDQEGSLVHRLGISRNAISNEIKAFEQVGLATKFYRGTEDSYAQHLDLAITQELLTNPELLPTKGERPRRKPIVCECGSMSFVKQSKVICAECGLVHSESEIHIDQDEDGTEETVFPSTPPVVEQETEQAQQPLCTREVHSVIEIEDRTREVHSDLKDWLAQRIGGTVIFSTGKATDSGKYLPFYGPVDPTHGYVNLDAFLAGELRSIYGSILPEKGTWESDIDDRDKAIHDRMDEFLSRLARAGAFPIYWQRAQQKGHLGIYAPGVNATDIDRWALSIVPEFAALRERYPVNTSNAISWPLFYRTGNEVHACAARYALPNSPDEIREVQGTSNPTRLQELTILVQECVTPAHLIEAYIQTHPIVKQEPTPQRATPQAGGVLGKDLARQYIAEFNAQRSWTDIAAMAGGFNRQGKFLAVWRGDRTPNVGINPRTDLAKDFARPDEPAMDKYDVWCKIMAHRLGQDGQLFKKQDLAQRCEYRRQQQERRAS